jgi:hypothetical protein
MNLQKQHWEPLTTLVLVAGHAVYTGADFQKPSADDNWYLQGFQRGEPPFYIEHIRYAVDLAASDPRSLLLFSGGQTRLEAGPRSEAQSYWLIANHFGWWQRVSVSVRATTEEYARDSFENVLFGICRFKECTRRYPELIHVVSWAFKEERFESHRAAVRWADSSAAYRFHGVNNPVDLDGARKGEAEALALFRDDPFGTEGKLAQKRIERNPFARHHPYFDSCLDLAGLLKHTTANGKQFPDSLPWKAA